VSAPSRVLATVPRAARAVLSPMSDPRGESDRRERRFIVALAIVAGLRALVFAGAFPFFTNVDEHRHVDMAMKYARGALPRLEAATYEPEFPRLLAVYGTQEYVQPAGRSPAPPLWALGEAEGERRIALNRKHFGAAQNLEIFQSPLYYSMAGAWLALGRSLGLDWGAALYAVRALGALALAALIFVAHRLVRETHPRSAAMRIGVPVLLSAAPLDVVHYVTGDSLSPLVGGLAFALLMRCAMEPDRSPAAFALAGLASAAAFLTKSTHIVVIGLLALVSLHVVWSAPADRRRGRLVRVALLGSALLVPAGLWVARTHSLTGSALGTASKVAGLGWGLRPFSAWGSHPLFTPAGAWEFLSGLVPIFWRGEVVWHRTVLASPLADSVYGLTTGAFLVAALLALRRREPGGAKDGSRLVELASLYCVGAATAVLAVLSLRFLFTETSNPSAAHPFFIQGRLVSGVWLPFAILYVRGIEWICTRLPERWRGPAVFAVIAFVAGVGLVSEIRLSLPVFESPYNFFHLPFGRG
jgi:hypothetical protein